MIYLPLVRGLLKHSKERHQHLLDQLLALGARVADQRYQSTIACLDKVYVWLVGLSGCICDECSGYLLEVRCQLIAYLLEICGR